MSTVTRRHFLKLSTAAALAASAASHALRGTDAPQASPLGRTGKARLRLSLAAYSVRENFPTMRGRPNANLVRARETDMFKFIDYCAAQGCEGAELTSYFFAEQTDDYMLKLRRHCFLRGIDVSGTAIGNNFSHPRGPQRDEEIRVTKQWIDRAVLMGAPHVRVFAGVAPKDFPRSEADKLAISALEECCDYAGRRGIFLGLENHDSLATADAVLAIVKAVKSPWLGINLDSGNFRTADPYRDFAACVPHAVNVQFKVAIAEASGTGKRPADMKRFVQLLRDGGYQGWVALEYEEPEDSAVAIPRALSEMKQLFAG